MTRHDPASPIHSTLPTDSVRFRDAIAGILGIAGAAATVLTTGRTLPFPSDLALGRLQPWAREVGAVVATFTALRAVGLVVLAWIAVTAVAGTASRRLRLTTLTRAIDRVSLPLVRRVSGAMAGAAVVVASLTTVTPAGAQTVPSVVMQDLGPVPPTTIPSPIAVPPTGQSTTLGPEAPVTMRLIEAPPVGPAEPPALDTWMIRPGDTLWHVAEFVASERAGHRADPEQTLAELTRIVAANADRLAVPGDADLVFPGQEFVLP